MKMPSISWRSQTQVRFHYVFSSTFHFVCVSMYKMIHSDGMTTFFAQRLNFIWILQIKHVIGEWSYHIIVKYERELILAFGLSCSFSILCWKLYTFMKKNPKTTIDDRLLISFSTFRERKKQWIFQLTNWHY